MRQLPDIMIDAVVRAALTEDLGRAGDVTAQACIPDGARMRAVVGARKAGVLAGIDCVRLAVLAMDPKASVEIRVRDGEAFEAGAVLAEIEGDARALLSAERTALNLLGRLCGVATLTRDYVRAVEGTGARIADTRKTTPGLRALEKHAVVCGGGINHRFGLDDAILIKDNHVAVCGGWSRRCAARARWPGT
jgi:nicotinate-nucleotide pyrophosphorylase (carboxylating)